jgi:hypothetical protein
LQLKSINGGYYGGGWTQKNLEDDISCVQECRVGGKPIYNPIMKIPSLIDTK